MRFMFILFGLLFFSQPSFSAPSQPTGGYFCSNSTIGKSIKKDASTVLIGQVYSFFKVAKIAIYIFCLAWGIFELTKSIFGSSKEIRWKQFMTIFMVFIITLFSSILLRIFSGEKVVSASYSYYDVRRPGVSLDRCSRSDRGATFIPFRYIREKK